MADIILIIAIIGYCIFVCVHSFVSRRNNPCAGCGYNCPYRKNRKRICRKWKKVKK